MNYKTILKFFLIVGFLFVVAALYLYQDTAEFVAVAADAEGTVIAMQRSSGGTWKPVVEWMDHTGAKRRLYSNAGSNPPRFFEGEKVSVLYDPDDPKYPVKARIRSTMQLWGVSIFLACFGAAWMLVASLAWYICSRGGVIYFGDGEEPEPRGDLF